MQLILFFIIGTTFGSFIALALQRIERQESIIIPRSHCDHCNTRLMIIDLIPVISYLILKGKCRYCTYPINKLTIISELIWGSVFSFQFIVQLPLLIFSSVIILTILSVIDIDKLMVPTKLIIIFLLNNLIYYFVFNHGSLMNLIITILIYLLALKINSWWIHVGDGDIDVIFIIWLIIGTNHILGLIIIASILALLYLLIYQKQNKIAFIPFLTIGYLLCILIYM
ncbi:prepilin peptidase [Lactobacillaceae bacterium Scapto_B20]